MVRPRPQIQVTLYVSARPRRLTMGYLQARRSQTDRIGLRNPIQNDFNEMLESSKLRGAIKPLMNGSA